MTMTDERLPASVLLLLDERARQVVDEGYDTEHDQQHASEELAAAAGTYALPNHLRPRAWRGPNRPGGPGFPEFPDTWPWAKEFWKPTPDDRVRELVKAGALILAELDRLILEQEGENDA